MLEGINKENGDYPLKFSATGNDVVSCFASAKAETRSPASLDNNTIQNSSRREWSSKQKRGYHRILSGLKKQAILGRQIRFMTLTTANYRDFPMMNRHFQTLRYRIDRKFGKMQYFKTKTNEGNGVLHIVYAGNYVPQSWLSRNWAELHGGSRIVDIRALKGSTKRIARYLVSQYVAGQSFIRNSWSWGWVCKGFVYTWERLKFRYENYSREKLFSEWDKFLYRCCYKDLKIDNFCIFH